MNPSLRTRLALYVLALTLLLLMCVVTALTTWRKRNDWERLARTFQSENATLAKEYKGAFLELNLRLLRYQLTRSAADRERFDADSAELARWLEGETTKVATDETRALLRALSMEFARFREEKQKAVPIAADANAVSQLLAKIDDDSRPILDLEARLSVLQRNAFSAFVTRMRRDLDTLWVTLFAALAALLICAGVLARVVYRDWIAPLRRSVQQSQALLERQEKLTALGRLTAGLAHEIRNPLNSIKARLFTQRRALSANAAGLEDNQFIDEEIDRLEGVVQEALQFARPGMPAFQRLKLATALQPFCELVEPSLRKAGIQFVRDFRENPEISADAQQLKQALLNLVNNAAESIGQDGTITLRTRRATLRQRRVRVPAVALEVEDTGAGISPEARKRLFDPFFTTKENGTGLGLSITAGIVHAHAGTIEAESKQGSGALFRVVLPLEGGRESKNANAAIRA